MIEICKFEDHWSLRICWWYIKLPFTVKTDPVDIIDHYGFWIDWEHRYIRFSWGPKRSRSFYFPWMWNHCYHEILTIDQYGNKFVEYEYSEEQRLKEAKWTAPYCYQLKSGEIQNRIATVKIERRTWYWHWFKWLGYPKMIKTSIDVSFDEEVGERSGSWKGGCVGCGYDLRLGEHPLQCLKRMEIERKFS